MPLIYTKTLTDLEVKILEHDLLDIRDWINKAIEGKINNCAKRAAREYQTLLIKEGAQTVPVNERVAFQDFIRRPDYKNRAQRDQDENQLIR